MKPTMTKKDLVRALTHINGLTQVQNESFVDDLMAVAKARLCDGGSFAIANLVRLDVVDVAARSGTSPLGGKWSKPAGHAVKAKTLGTAKKMFEAGS